MNPSKYLDCEYIVAPNYLPLQGNSWETKQFKNVSHSYMIVN